MYMLYLVLAVFFLHILVLPMVFSAKIDVDSDISHGKIVVKLYFIPIFVKKLHFDTLNDILNGVPVEVDNDKEAENQKKSPSKFKSALKRFFIAVAIRIAKRVRVRELELNAKIGTGDAAATAVTVSSALVAYCQACALLGVSISEGAITPDYDRSLLFIKFYGIISLCIADIIYAVLSQILSKFARHGKGAAYGKHVVTE